MSHLIRGAAQQCLPLGGVSKVYNSFSRGCRTVAKRLREEVCMRLSLLALPGSRGPRRTDVASAPCRQSRLM